MASIAKHEQRKYLKDEHGVTLIDPDTGRPKFDVVGHTWRARYRDAAGKEHARHFARKVDAQRWLDSVTTAVGTGTYVDPGRSAITVGAMAATWMSTPSWTPSTRARNESILNIHVLPRWGTVRLASIELESVQVWANSLVSAGLAAGTVHKIVGVLRAVLTSAVRGRRLASNPVVGVALPRQNVARRKYLTTHQVEALAEAAGGHQIVVMVLAYCGLRWGELAALRARDVDILRRRLQVERSVTEVNGRLAWGAPKDHQRRSVPFPAFLRPGIEAALRGRGIDDLLFPAGGDTPLRVRNARRDWFDTAAAEAGVPGLTPHELRHTAASLAVAAGANVLAVQRMLGHEKASMTLDIYSDLFDSDLDTLADRLDEARARGLADSLRTSPGPNARAHLSSVL